MTTADLYLCLTCDLHAAERGLWRERRTPLKKNPTSSCEASFSGLVWLPPTTPQPAPALRFPTALQRGCGRGGIKPTAAAENDEWKAELREPPAFLSRPPARLRWGPRRCFQLESAASCLLGPGPPSDSFSLDLGPSRVRRVKTRDKELWVEGCKSHIFASHLGKRENVSDVKLGGPLRESCLRRRLLLQSPKHKNLTLKFGWAKAKRATLPPRAACLIHPWYLRHSVLRSSESRCN